MTTNDEQEFENFLQSFEPLAPAPLVFPSRYWRFVPVLAVAALMVVAIGLSLLIFPGHPSAAASGANTLGGIGHATQGDPAKLDTVLGSRAHTSLPDVERSHGALHVLASE